MQIGQRVVHRPTINKQQTTFVDSVRIQNSLIICALNRFMRNTKGTHAYSIEGVYSLSRLPPTIHQHVGQTRTRNAHMSNAIYLSITEYNK